MGLVGHSCPPTPRPVLAGRKLNPSPTPLSGSLASWYWAKFAGSQTVPPWEDKLGGLVTQNLGPSLGREKTSHL